MILKVKMMNHVAVIMNAWWMWKKWNWPPADCIIPKLLSMHINNYGVARKSSPIYAEWAQGCGGEFFKYGPVGCRMASLDFKNRIYRLLFLADVLH